MDYAAMNENLLIRVENLRRLRLSAVELSDRVGGRVSYWHGMLAGTRPFGEKVARKIEEALGLPRGAMDEDEGVARAAAPPYKPSGFALQLAMLYDELPADDAVRATAWVNSSQALRAAGAQQSTPAAGAPAPSRSAKQRHE